MTVYKRSVIVTASISIVSLIIATSLNYVVKEKFWSNVCLGLFGSSILTMITSIIGYFVERKNCMEGFYTETLKFAGRLKRYYYITELEEKINFFLNMMDYDIANWDDFFSKIDFFCKKQRDYIFHKIYVPLMRIEKNISKSEWRFRMYKCGTGGKQSVIADYVNEIEKYFYEIEDIDDFFENGNKSKIIDKVICEELLVHYCEIMRGKKKYQKWRKETCDN